MERVEVGKNRSFIHGLSSGHPATTTALPRLLMEGAAGRVSGALISIGFSGVLVVGHVFFDLLV